MPPGKLDAAVLVALGLAAAGCGEKEDTADTAIHPCLSPETTDTGPCLTPADDTGDTGPCLDYPQDTGDTGGAGDAVQEQADRQDTDAHAREGALRRVLARGVLPADVAKLLGKTTAEK